MIRFISPIREKTRAILNDEVYLKEIMAKGAAKARKSAQATLQRVRTAMGLDYF
jgi:tryptophanyl-tRNA synthetase